MKTVRLSEELKGKGRWVGRERREESLDKLSGGDGDGNELGVEERCLEIEAGEGVAVERKGRGSKGAKTRAGSSRREAFRWAGAQALEDERAEESQVGKRRHCTTS